MPTYVESFSFRITQIIASSPNWTYYIKPPLPVISMQCCKADIPFHPPSPHSHWVYGPQKTSRVQASGKMTGLGEDFKSCPSPISAV